MRKFVENFANGVTHYNFDNGLTVRIQLVEMLGGQRINCNTYRRNADDKFVAEIIKDECISLTADGLVEHLLMVSRRKPKKKLIFPEVAHGSFRYA